MEDIIRLEDDTIMRTFMKVAVLVESAILWIFMGVILFGTPISIASVILASLCFVTAIIGLALVSEG